MDSISASTTIFWLSNWFSYEIMVFPWFSHGFPTHHVPVPGHRATRRQPSYRPAEGNGPPSLQPSGDCWPRPQRAGSCAPGGVEKRMHPAKTWEKWWKTWEKWWKTWEKCWKNHEKCWKTMKNVGKNMLESGIKPTIKGISWD